MFCLIFCLSDDEEAMTHEIKDIQMKLEDIKSIARDEFPKDADHGKQNYNLFIL